MCPNSLPCWKIWISSPSPSKEIPCHLFKPFSRACPGPGPRAESQGATTVKHHPEAVPALQDPGPGEGTVHEQPVSAEKPVRQGRHPDCRSRARGGDSAAKGLRPQERGFRQRPGAHQAPRPENSRMEDVRAAQSTKGATES